RDPSTGLPRNTAAPRSWQEARSAVKTAEVVRGASLEVRAPDSARDGQVQRPSAAASIDGERAELGKIVGADAVGDPLRDFDESARDGGAGSRLNHGRSRVTPLAHARINRNLPEKWGLGVFGYFLSTASAEEIVTFRAAVADEIALVLD